jgi:multidrug transporter EmrE-like cation transporter
MNIGVIALGSLVGLWLFKEKLSRLNYMGIGLAVLAILLISLA